MKRIKRGELSFWEFDNLGGLSSLKHFVSERTALGNGEFTLSYSSTPDKDLVKSNREKVAAALGIRPEKFFMPSQVHKTRIVRVTSDTHKEELMETDSLMTNEKGICIGVMSADCVPILLYDHENHACAAIHSGWKGTVSRILEKTLNAMRETFGTDGKNIIAGTGPSASQASYEVGEEVITAVESSFKNADTLMIYKPNKKAMLNLWQANRSQLLEAGVPEQQIEISNLCTIPHNDYFFSARKGDSGRFAAGILLN